MSATGSSIHTITVMGTFTTIQVVGDQSDPKEIADREAAIERAFGWFHCIEECCSRFEPASELSQLARQIGVPVPVSEILYEAVQFAIAVAEESDGAFDPTVGVEMETRGFNREYRTRRVIHTGIAARGVSYRDVRLDPKRRTITLLRPLMLDLGAVAKGLAIDMAARDLASFTGFAIDAGGDLFLGGCRLDGAPWTVGIRHPRDDRALIDAVRVSNRAVCTSGDYERRSGGDAGHHIIDARSGTPATMLASVTVVAPTAMLADALATAAFALGPDEGIRLLERHGVEGLLVTPTLQRHATRGFPSDYSILQDTKGPADDRLRDPAGDGGADRGHQPDVWCSR
jgi:thiamine biosynthesis lipoprotein